MRTHQWRRLTSRPVNIALIIAVALTLGGCGFSIGCSAGDDVDTQGSGDVGETKSYTDPDYGFSFDYPTDWELDDNSQAEVEGGLAAAKGVSAFDPEGAKNGDYFLDVFQVSVYELSMTVDESMLPDVKPELESVVAGIASQDESWETLEAMSAAEVGGLKGYKTTVTHAMDSEMVKSTLYFLFDGDIEYELMLQASVDDWEGAQAALGSMLASFQPRAATDETDEDAR